MHSVGRAGLEPILRLIDGVSSGSDVTSEQELCAWGPEAWAQLLRHLPIDAYTFLGELERLGDRHRPTGPMVPRFPPAARALPGAVPVLLGHWGCL